MNMIGCTPMMLILLSTILCVSSKSWMMVWFMLEMNTLGFLMIMSKDKKKETAFIFFLFQSLASMLMLVFIFYCNLYMSENFTKAILYMIMVSITLKIGMYPFWGWVTEITKNMTWVNMLILLTWQKMIPIFILFKCLFKISMNMVFIVSMIAVSSMMVKMSNNKNILVMSSLVHNSWMLFPMSSFKIMSTMYLMIYSMLMTPLTQIFKKTNMKSILNQTKIMSEKKEMMKLMLSLSGLPPSIGFLIKIMVLLALLKKMNPKIELTVIMVTASLSVWVYFKIFYKNINFIKMCNQKKNKTMKNKKKSFMWGLIIMPSMMALM